MRVVNDAARARESRVSQGETETTREEEERLTDMTTTTGTLSGIGIPTGTWKIDKAHTRVGFVVRTLGVSTVRGEFRKFDGALEIGEDLDNARAYGRVDASSVDTNQAKRDTHLRSPDFLSAERHPELTLRSKAIEPVGDGIRKVHGNNHDPSRNGFGFGSNSWTSVAWSGASIRHQFHGGL